MKPVHRLALVALSFLASIGQGSGCAPDRQIVYPERRKPPVPAQPRARARVRVKAPVVPPSVPSSNVDPNPARIDVPMIEPR